MTGSQHFSPGDIQFQLVHDRDQCAESSYLKATSHLTIFMRGMRASAKFKGMITNAGNAGSFLRVKRR